MLAVLAIGALVAGSVALSGRDGGPAVTTSAVTTSAVTPAPVPTLAPSTTVVASTSTVPEPSTTTPPPFGEPTSLVVYLTPRGSNSAPDTILVYEVDTGIEHELHLGRDVGWYHAVYDGAGGTVVDGGAVVAVVRGDARVLDDDGAHSWGDAPNGRVAPGPNGGLWLRGLDPPAVELVDAAGARTGRRYPLALGAELFGSMADGRPVVRGADRRAAAIELDGTRTPLDGIPLNPVENSRYIEVRCDAEQKCGAYGHLDDGAVLELGPMHDPSGAPILYRLAPDGPPTAAIIRDETLTLRDPSGAVMPVPVADVDVTGFGPDTFRVGVRFLPDGRGLVVQMRGGLAFVDRAGRVLSQVALGGPTILGVGRAHAWAP